MKTCSLSRCVKPSYLWRTWYGYWTIPEWTMYVRSPSSNVCTMCTWKVAAAQSWKRGQGKCHITSKTLPKIAVNYSFSEIFMLFMLYLYNFEYFGVHPIVSYLPFKFNVISFVTLRFTMLVLGLFEKNYVQMSKSVFLLHCFCGRVPANWFNHSSWKAVAAPIIIYWIVTLPVFNILFAFGLLS